MSYIYVCIFNFVGDNFEEAKRYTDAKNEKFNLKNRKSYYQNSIPLKTMKKIFFFFLTHSYHSFYLPNFIQFWYVGQV